MTRAHPTPPPPAPDLDLDPLWLDLRPLLTPAGEPYDENDLPCYWLPHLWDEDATAAENRHAAELCTTECPAVAACAARRLRLNGAAEGVWAGEIITPADTGPDYYDLQVAALRTELGLTETLRLN